MTKEWAKIVIHDKDGKIYKAYDFPCVEIAHELAKDFSNAKQYKACFVTFFKNGKSDWFWV